MPNRMHGRHNSRDNVDDDEKQHSTMTTAAAVQVMAFRHRRRSNSSDYGRYIDKSIIM